MLDRVALAFGSEALAFTLACPSPPPKPPIQASAVVSQSGEEVAVDQVLVLVDSSIDANGEHALDEVAKVLRDNPALEVQIDGHTDAVGTEAYNRGLSDRRADAARKYLVSAGIDSSRLTSRGFGESQPIADNGTADGRAQNRRTEIEVVN